MVAAGALVAMEGAGAGQMHSVLLEVGASSTVRYMQRSSSSTGAAARAAKAVAAGLAQRAVVEQV